jgi:hypothetical protein
MVASTEFPFSYWLVDSSVKTAVFIAFDQLVKDRCEGGNQGNLSYRNAHTIKIGCIVLTQAGRTVIDIQVCAPFQGDNDIEVLCGITGSSSGE